MCGVTTRKVGLEEELLLVDPQTGALRNVSTAVLHRHRAAHSEEEPPESHVDAELLQHMVETHTVPTTDLDEMADRLRVARRTALAVASEAGVAVAATGTAPLAGDEPRVTPESRYRRIVAEFGEVGRGAGTLAMHLHVDISDAEEGVRIVDGLRPWLPVLVALAANSPYAGGVDTGYASWRHQVWHRWPSAGPAEPFGSVAEYHRVSQALVETGAALDLGMLYFDARLSASFPTVEVRVADTCTDLADVVLVAALTRALVETVARSEPPSPLRTDLLRAAHWRAARHGLSADLAHPVHGRLAPAREVLDLVVEAVAPALRETGDLDRIRESLDRLASVGGGARRQRQAFERSGDLGHVVADLVERTAASVEE